jgi:hypothetical protein
MQLAGMAVGLMSAAALVSGASGAITTFDVYLNGFNEVTARACPTRATRTAGGGHGW